MSVPDDDQPSARGELVVVATPIGNLGDLSPQGCRDARRSRRRRAAKTRATPASCSPAWASAPPASSRCTRTTSRERVSRGARAARRRCTGRPRERRRHARRVRPGRAGDRGGDRGRPPGHERAGAFGRREPRSCWPGSGRRAGASRASCRGGEPSARARLGEIAAAPASERHLRGAAAGRRHACAISLSGAEPIASSRSRASSRSDSRRPGTGLSLTACERASATPPRGEHVLVVAGAHRRASVPQPERGADPSRGRTPHVGRRQPAAGRGRGGSGARRVEALRLRDFAGAAATGSLGACQAVSS